MHISCNVDMAGAALARRLRDRPDVVDVRVRVAFERVGETWLDGTATRWHGRHVFVRIDDERARLQFVWVDAGDVRRR